MSARELEALAAENARLMRALEEAQRATKMAESDAHMYANAWQREIGPFGIRNKRHHIDAMVLTTRQLVADVVEARTMTKAVEQWKVDAATARTIGLPEPDLIAALRSLAKERT